MRANGAVISKMELLIRSIQRTKRKERKLQKKQLKKQKTGSIQKSGSIEVKVKRRKSGWTKAGWDREGMTQESENNINVDGLTPIAE